MPIGTELTARSIARTVLIVVAVLLTTFPLLLLTAPSAESVLLLRVLLTIYVLYLLRKPLAWLIIAAFIAIAAAGPVNVLQRRMKRGFAIAIVYAVIVLIPIGLSALLVPPIVGEVEDVANNAPEYVQDVEDYVNKNETLQNLNDDYDITTKLQEEAQKLPERIPDAAGALSDIGVGFVNSASSWSPAGRGG